MQPIAGRRLRDSKTNNNLQTAIRFQVASQVACHMLHRYIGVGEEEQVQLFYYFIKYEGNPEEDPILLWLSGGPGCSSISGLLYENDFEYNSLDQPVETGFSYSTTHKLASKPSDSGEAKCIHEFLHKWLNKHQEFVSNPFYVGGDQR
ncbi:hypothetical protein Bca101_073808 [Brassica carinata]